MAAMKAHHLEDVFDPAIHLDYIPPSSTFDLKELGIKSVAAPAPIAGSVPFSFLSREGVRAYRRALLTPEVVTACATIYGPDTVILRNVARYSKFIKDLWTHPETIRIVSDVAGIPLCVIMPMEIGHTNIQASGSSIKEMVWNLKSEPSTECVEVTQERDHDPLAANSVVPWHYDSYPYVCILMLSDTTHMIGGETYIKQGDGIPRKIEGPKLGYAVVLQGRVIEHLAARASGVAERITAITSYRADVDGLYDDSYLSNVRPYSNLDHLYRDWVTYRIEKMKYEIGRMQSIVEEGLNRTQHVPVSLVSEFTEYHQFYALHTARQMPCPILCKDMVGRFGRRAIFNAGLTWARVRAHPRFEQLLPTAMESTKTWALASGYLVDWYVSKGVIDRGEILPSYNGPLPWDRSQEYTFGDELLRQGLKEVLLAWLDRVGLLILA